MAAYIRYKLGKLPPKNIKVKLRDYLTLSTLPKPPLTAGHTDIAEQDHNMFGNDTVGDCTCCDVGHETLLWNSEAGKTVNISTANVLALYSAVSGYNGTPETDQGANMADVAEYHRTVGLQDESGNFHKCLAYMAVTPGNLEELKQSIYLFGGCSIGWELPLSAQEQTQTERPWTVVSGSPIEGGHDTLAVGYDRNFIYIMTWGQVQKVSYPFFAKYMDEGIVKLSEEFLTNNVSLEGFNLTQLQEDINSL